MRKCKECKHQLNKKDKFCTQCGTPVKKSKWRWVIWIVILLLLIGGSLYFFYPNDQADETTPSESIDSVSSSSDETSKQDQEKEEDTEQEDKAVKDLSKELSDNTDLLSAAVSWYGDKVIDSPKWDSWDLQKTDYKKTKFDDTCTNTEQGDGTYYGYKFTDGRNNNSGFVLSEDHKNVYLYNRYSVAQGIDEEPIATVSIDDLAKAIINDDKLNDIKKSAKGEKIKSEDDNKDKKSDIDVAQKQQLISDYMSDWQEAMGQEYEEDTVTPGDNVIEMQDVTITNDLSGGDDALLSINAKFVDLDTKQESKQGYQVIAAYSGVSDNAKKYRYLFVMHNGKPEVLVAHMPEAVGDTDRGPAVNFVPTQNAALPGAFKQIMDDGSAPQAPEKQENVVNSLDDAKALYEEACGSPVEEGPWENEPSVVGTWISNSDGSFTYEWHDESRGRFGEANIHSDGSITRKGFIHGETYQGSCTYEDIQNGIAQEKLSGQ